MKPQLFLLLALLAGCRPADVVAEVGGRRITQDDVRARLRSRPTESVEQAVDALIAEERLASSASKAELQNKADVRARLRSAERAILMQAALDAEMDGVDEKTLLAEYDASKTLAQRQLELAHIFFALPTPVTNDGILAAQGRANAAWARLLGGDSFEDVARATSEDTVTKDQGGLLGVVKEGQLDATVFEAAAALAPGANSKPIQTSFGFHILKAVSAVTTVKPTFAQARGTLERQVRDARLAALTKRLESSVPATKYDAALAPLAKGDGR